MLNNMLVTSRAMTLWSIVRTGIVSILGLRLNQQDLCCPYSLWRQAVPTLDFNTILTEQHIGSLLLAPE